ncbi:MAG: hypothetical protein V7K60_09885 [Nostoc sp.]
MFNIFSWLSMIPLTVEEVVSELNQSFQIQGIDVTATSKDTLLT